MKKKINRKRLKIAKIKELFTVSKFLDFLSFDIMTLKNAKNLV
jgi:hypothetical protein